MPVTAFVVSVPVAVTSPIIAVTPSSAPTTTVVVTGIRVVIAIGIIIGSRSIGAVRIVRITSTYDDRPMSASDSQEHPRG